MKRLVFLAAILLGLTLPASATLVSLPNNFANGAVIDATQVMANYNAIAAVVNGNIDHSNVTSSSGFYSSDIKPTTTLAGTVGGSVPITFPNGIIMSALTASLPLCLDVNKALSTTCSATAYVTSVTATGVLSSSGGVTPNITLSGVVPTANGGCNATSYTVGSLLYYDGTKCASATVSSPLSFSGGALSCSTCITTATNHVKLSIGMGFNAGAVSTSTVFPTQPVVAYTGGQITGFRVACATADNGTTVFTFTRNGSSIGTLTLANGTVVSSTTLGGPVTITAGDYLGVSITTAGTAQNCGVIAEGQQQTY